MVKQMFSNTIILSFIQQSCDFQNLGCQINFCVILVMDINKTFPGPESCRVMVKKWQQHKWRCVILID